MAYLQSRSNIARSGVTHIGWTPPSLTAYVNGVDKTSSVLAEEWTLTLRADGSPPTFQFLTKGFTPSIGHDVILDYAKPDEYLFRGTILQRRLEPFAPDSASMKWQCTAVGYQWLIDRFDRVHASYVNRGVGTIVGDILHRFTDGGFVVGYIPSSLGNLSIDFTFETVWGALTRIAAAVDARLELTPSRRVNIYQTYPEAALTSVVDSAILGGSFVFDQDLTQARTRTLFQYQTTTAPEAVPAGSPTISVADTSIFSASGGFAVHRQSLVTYTGRSTASGAGVLTGCNSLTQDISENDEIAPLVEVEDGTAQTALATLLGGGLSGQATHYLQDGRLSESEATARATKDLTVFGSTLQDTGFVFKTPVRHLRAGRAITLNITNPVAIAGTSTVQVVTMVPRGAVGSTNFEMWQSVQLGTFARSLIQLLTKQILIPDSPH